MKKSLTPLVVLTLTLLTISPLIVLLPVAQPVVLYTIALIGASIIYLAFAGALRRNEFSQTALLLSLAAALLVRLALIPAAPVGSDDIYRYLWDGKVQAAGINPYAYAPDSSALQHLHSPLLPGSVNHPDMKTLYFPFSEWIFSLGYTISGESPAGMKCLFVLAEAATIAGLMLLLGQFGIPKKFVLLYAFSPLAIFQFSLDGHVDVLGFPFLVFGLLLYQREKTIPALVLLGLSMSVKPVALVLMPILFFATPSWRRRIGIALVPLATIGIQFLPYLRTSNPFESLLIFAKNWTFNGAIFELLNAFVSNNQTSRTILVLLLGFLLIILALRRKELLDKLHLSILLLLLLSPVVHPWYIAWLAVFLPLTQRWSGVIYVATASLTSLTILHYKLYGIWEQSPLILALEYLPVLYCVWREWRSAEAVASIG